MRGLVVVVVIALGCGGGSAGPRSSTPREAFDSIQEARRRGDAERLWALMTPEGRDEMLGLKEIVLASPAAKFEAAFGFPQHELVPLEGKALFVRLYGGPAHREDPAPRIDAIDEDGDRATIRWREEDLDCTLELERTLGGWRGDSLAECAGPAVVVKPPAAPAPAPMTTATLKLLVEPTGATVEIDGVARGVAPLVLELFPGQYALRVAHPGHDTYTVQLDVAEGESQTLRIVLPPAP